MGPAWVGSHWALSCGFSLDVGQRLDGAGRCTDHIPFSHAGLLLTAHSAVFRHRDQLKELPTAKAGPSEQRSKCSRISTQPSALSSGHMPVDRVPRELWTDVRDTVQEAVIKAVPKKKKGKKAKWLSEETLQIAEQRSQRQRRRGKIYPFEYRVLKNSKER